MHGATYLCYKGHGALGAGNDGCWVAQHLAQHFVFEARQCLAQPLLCAKQREVKALQRVRQPAPQALTGCGAWRVRCAVFSMRICTQASPDTPRSGKEMECISTRARRQSKG